MPQSSRRLSSSSNENSDLQDNLESIYVESASEEEDWGEGAWEVNGIVGEHTSTRGGRRYQVAWEGWARSDDSNWTWEREDNATMKDLSDMLKHWQKEKSKQFKREIESPLVPPFQPHLFSEGDDGVEDDPNTRRKKYPPVRYVFTELTHQAHEMAVDHKNEGDFEQSVSLKSASERIRDMRAARDATLKSLNVDLQEAVSHCLYELGPAPEQEGCQVRNNLPLHQQLEALNVSEELPTRSSSPTQITAQVANDQTQGSKPSLPSHSLQPSRFSMSQLIKGPGKTREISNKKRPPHDREENPNRSGSQSTNLVRVIHSLPRRSSGIPRQADIARAHVNLLSRREALQAEWSAIIRAANAAPLTIVNDLNDEDIPALNPKTFKYLEADYLYGAGIPRSDEFMESCTCTSKCVPYKCACQDDSEIPEGRRGTGFAYDSKGLFTFSENITSYVIECNKNCPCDASCGSRVAQRPRMFPIEVFCTVRCGWGVRSTVSIPKGSVLGVYTGEIITREVASKFDMNRAIYLFDLDFMVTGPRKGYSVDAYNCGNWTRFVNHSCDPLCSVFPVVWDSVPAMHQPKMALVAKVDIPARREFTLDYSPKSRKGKGKNADKMPGTPDCMCGAHNCRGYIYLK